MTTENVIAKYEKCDGQLQGEIKNRRNASSTNLAFSIVLHRDVAILEHQLKLLFRPNHAFCLHVDAKAPEKILLAVQALVDCYKTAWPGAMMVIPTGPVSTYWGHISLVESDLKCFESLEAEFSDWTHVMNLAGSELPTRPVGEIEAAIRTTLGEGQSFAYSRPVPEKYKRRIEISHELNFKSRFLSFLDGVRAFRYDQVPLPVKGTKKKSPPPHGLTVFKGLKNVILSRPMVRFILNDAVAIDFKKWLEDTSVPDESFYATMIRVEFNNRSGEVRQDLQ